MANHLEAGVSKLAVDSTVARRTRTPAGARRRGDLQAEPPADVQAEPAGYGPDLSRSELTAGVHLGDEKH
jgi:hypothetical protein